MRTSRIALPFILGLLTASPCLADSVTVTSGPNGTVTSSKPCRVVTRDGHESKDQSASNSTTITNGPNGMSGTTSVSPGGAGTSVTVGSGSSSGSTTTSSAAGGDCVIYRDK